MTGQSFRPLLYWRTVAAFAVTPFLIVLGFVVFGAGAPPTRLGFGEIVFMACAGTMMFGYPLTIIVVVPVYLFLRGRLRMSVINCVLIGACVTTLPWLLLMSPGLIEGFRAFNLSNADSVPAHWGTLLNMIGEIAGLGAVAGFVFWLIAAAGARRAA